MGEHNSKLQPQVLTEFTSQTAFSEHEVKEWYKGFQHDYPSGFLTVDQFKKIYGNFYPHGDAAGFAESTFRVFDRNGDGHLDFREFITGLSISTRGSFDEKMKWIFELYDANGNGYISRDEMETIVRAIHEMSTGESYDISVQRQVNKIYEKAHVNSTDISLEEFIALAKTYPTIANVMTGDMAEH